MWEGICQAGIWIHMVAMNELKVAYLGTLMENKFKAFGKKQDEFNYKN